MTVAGGKKRLRIITRGCSKNKVDTEHILAQAGDSYELVPEGGEQDGRFIDIVAVNTCGFIGDAKEESINTVLEVAERKKAGEVGKIVVFGCLSQRYSMELPELIPEVDAWLGARDVDEVIKALGISPEDRKSVV